MAATDPRFDKAQAPMLGSADRFKLAVFGVNDDRGLVLTTAPGPPEGKWDQSLRLAQEADRLGFEGIIPISRWLGYGGSHNPGERCLDAFAWAAGLAARTERIQVLATLHAPTMHPVMAAKMGATIDHISSGRFGLNIVAGWQPDEIAMFSATHRQHDDRYAYADEWVRLLKQLWTEEDSFDFEGEFLNSPGARSEPKPLQKPYPFLMNAGISPAGRKFAAAHSDVVFAAIAEREKTAETVAEIKNEGREHGRELRVFGRGHITCGESEKEAQATYDYFFKEHGDREAGENFVRMNMSNSQTVDWSSVKMQSLVDGAIRGCFGHPMTGTPEQVVASIGELADAGFDGAAITWNNYEEGLRQYEEELLPLLVEAGLREPLPESTPRAATSSAA